MGGVDQLQGDVDVAVVVVADLGNQEAGFALGYGAAPELQAARRLSGHRHDPAMAVQQRQGDDPGGQQGGQVRGRAVLPC